MYESIKVVMKIISVIVLNMSKLKVNIDIDGVYHVVFFSPGNKTNMSVVSRTNRSFPILKLKIYKLLIFLYRKNLI